MEVEEYTEEWQCNQKRKSERRKKSQNEKK